MMTSLSLVGHKDSVLCVVCDPCSPPLLASGSEDSTVRIWDLRTCKSIRCLRGPFAGLPVSSIVFGPPASSSSPGSPSTTIHAAAGTSLHTFDLRRPDVVLSSADASHACASDEINEITARLDARGQPHLAAADDSGAVYVMNAVTGKLVKVIRRHSMFASCVDFRPAVGQLEFVSGGFDCTALVCDAFKGRVKASVSLSSDGVDTGSAPVSSLVNPPYAHSVRYSASGLYFAVGVGDGSVSVHEAGSGRCTTRVWPHTKATGRVEFPAFLVDTPCAHLQDDVVVSCGNDGRVVVLDLRQNEPTAAPAGKRKGLKGKGPAKAAGEPEPALPCDDDRSRVLFAIDHGSGPNWLCTTSACGGAIAVADTTSVVTVYTGVTDVVISRLMPQPSTVK